MTSMPVRRATSVAAAFAIGLTLIGVARAQEVAPMSGLIMGEVDRCTNGAETPAPQVAVGVVGGSGNLGRTDANGQFLLALPPGQYTIVANADDGTTANRPYVPVEAGQALDIGILDLGGGLAGCGPASDLTEPVLPTMTAVPAVLLEATATAVPTPPPPTATPAPPDQAPAPQMPPDQPAQDQPPPDAPPPAG